jgi:hypothetical protein
VPSEPASTTRDEQLAALLASSPPRTVPRELLRAAGRQASSGPLGLIGFIFAFMGLFFAAMFSPWDVVQDWQLAATETATAPGQVLSVDRTSTSINKQRVFRYKFAFQPRPGVHLQGDCFTTGTRWRSGGTVTVRFSVSDPELCCIEGARLSESGAVGLVLVLFPLIGIGLLISSVIGRRRLRWLLENGAVEEAMVTAIEQTMMRMNRQNVYKITLQRTDPAGGTPFVLRKYQSSVIEFARQRLGTKQPVFVLYDPAHPRRVLLPETL